MNLITDRTYADVLLGTEKGCYGVADLNRVEQAVAELVGIAKALDIQDDFVIKLDWGLPGVFSAVEWPAEGQMVRYLRNIARLCETVAVAAELPPSMENLTWKGANQIEQALELVYTRIRTILQAFQYSGEIFAGEENDL